MALDELKAALETNPNDTRTFQTHLEPILGQGSTEEFDAFLETVLEAVSDENVLTNLMRAADLKAKSTGGDIRVHVSYKVGRVFLDLIGNEDMAEMYFRRVPPESDYAAELHDFYVNFFTKKQNWRKLEQHFQTRAELEGVEEAEIEAKRKTARLARETGNLDRATSYWQALRKKIPDDEEVQTELISLYKETDKWHQVADILKARADSLDAERVDEKVALYLELVPIYRDRMKMDAKVSTAYQAVLKIQPDNVEAFEALCSHYESSERWPDLVKLLKARVEASDDEERKFEFLERIANVMENQFSNVTEAIRAYESMADIRPEDLNVIRKLKSLYEQRRDWQSYVTVAQRELDHLEGDERLESLRELAQLALNNVRDADVGIELWREVREADPSDREAFDALMMLYERGKNFEGVAGLLEERIDHVEPEERQQLLERLALLYGARIHDMEKAANAWKRLLELDGENHRAKAELKKILVKSRDLETLDWFFRTYGSLNDYARTLDLMVKDEEDDTLKVQLLFKQANLYLEEDAQEERARRALESVLTIEERNVQCAEMLAPIYQTLSRWEDLVNTQELLLQEKKDLEDDERLMLLLDKAQVHEERLKQIDEAFFTYIEAYQLDWQRSDIYEELERLAEASGNWNAFISVLDSTLERIEDDNQRVPYLIRIGEIWDEKIGDFENAMAYFSQVIEIDETNLKTMSALERLYRNHEKWEDLKRVLISRLEVDDDADERCRLLSELGTVCREQLDDPEGARSAYQRLVEEYPQAAVGYDHLGDVLLQEEEHEELLALLKSRLDALQPEGAELAELLTDIGMLSYGVEGDVQTSVDFYMRALEVDLDQARAISLLEELIAHEESQYKICVALAPVYELREDLVRLADCLEIQLNWVEREEQIGLLYRVKGLYMQLDNLEAAARTVRRTIRLLPEDAELREELENLADGLGDWTPVVELYTEIIADIADTDYRHVVLRKAADIYHRQLQDKDAARKLYRDVLEEAPGDSVSLSALEEIAIEEEDWEGLLGIFETRKDLEADADSRISVMFSIANVARDHLGDLEKASSTVEGILEEDPTNLEALHFLDELYTHQEKWDDLLRSLEQTVALVEEAEARVGLHLRMAELFEQKLDQPEGIVQKLTDALSEDPDNEQAVTILERNIDGDIALSVLDLLEAFMRRHENFDRLIKLLRTRKDFVDDTMTRLEIQKEIARIFEELKYEPTDAFREYREALKMDPDNEDTLEHLLVLTQQLENHAELFEVLQEETEGMEETPQQVRMWRTMASIARVQLDQADTAIEYFQKVADREPEDVETLVSLETLYRDAERWTDLARILDSHAELSQDVDERKGLLLEAGSIYHTLLDSVEAAIGRYEELLQIDPDDITALTNLQNLYEETENHEELEQILERRARISDDPDERRGLMLRRAEVLEQPLERLEDANQVLSELYNADPTDLEIVERLEALHEKREDWLALLDILRHKLEVSADEERIPVLLKTARVYSDELADIHQANETYRLLLEQFPGHGEAVDELERIVLELDEKEEAYNQLKPILEEKEEWERLLMVMGALKDGLHDPESQLQLLLEMAGMADHRLGDLNRAFMLTAEALKKAPGRVNIAEGLEELADRAELLEDVVRTYGEISEEAGPSEEGVALLLRKANLLKTQIGDLERAIEEYEALRETTEDPIVLASLDELYNTTRQWSKLTEILQEEMERTPSVEEKLAFHYRLAMTYEEELDLPEKAMDVIKEAYMLDSENEQTLEFLRRLYDDKIADEEAADLLETHYTTHSEFEDVAHVLGRRFSLTEDKVLKLELAQKLVTVFLDRLDNQANGLQFLGEALVLDPEDTANLDLLLQLMRDTGLREDTVNYLQLSRLEAESTESFRRLSMEAGRLLMELEQFEDAELAFNEVVERDEEHLPAYTELEKMMETQERHSDHEKILETMVKLQDFDDDKIGLLLKQGRLRRDLLDTADGAIEAFEQVLVIDDRNEEALHSLSSLYETEERYEPLTRALLGLIELTQDNDQKVALLSQLAILQEEKLDDRDQAIFHWNEVLDWSPNEATVMQTLQRLYSEQEDWQSFVDMAEREVRLEETEDEPKVDLWRRIAQVATEYLDEPLLAQQNWESVREHVPNDEEALQNLRELYRQNENHMKLGELLETMAFDEERDAEQRLTFFIELGTLRTEDLMDLEGAIAAWQQVLELKPDSLDAYRALEQLYMDTMKFQEAVVLLQDKLVLLSDVDEKIELLEKIANLQEESLNQWSESADTRKLVLELQPNNLEQYDRIAVIYEAHTDWPALTRILLNRIDVEEEPEDKVSLLTRIAQLREEKLEDDTGALEAIIRALGFESDEPELLAMGERIATRSELWSQLHTMWSSVVDELTDEQQKLDILMKLGALTRDRLLETEEAIGWFEKVLELNDEHENALISLVGLYESRDEWEKLAGKLETLAEVTPDFKKQIDYSLQLGQTLYTQMGDKERAQKAYRNALELDPTEEAAVEALQTLYTETEDWEELIEILGMRSSLHPEEDTELKLIAGELMEVQLGQPLRAAEQYEELAAYDPNANEAFERLERIYTEHEEWQKLVETYEKKLAITNEREVRVEILRRLALLSESALDDTESAADYYQQIIDIQPEDAETIEALEKLYAEQERFDDLVLVLRRMVDMSETISGKVEALEKIATIHVEQLDDSGSATMAYREILELDPGHLDTLLKLEKLCAEQGDWMDVVDVLDQRIALSSDVDEIVQLLLRKGDIYRVELMMPDKAREHFHLALEQGATASEPVEKLIEMYTEGEQWAKIVKVLLTQAREVQDEQRKARIFARMGTYLKDKLGNYEEAIEVLEAALEKVPNLLEASMPLSQIYIDQEQWAKAYPLLEMMREGLEQNPEAPELTELYRQLAQVSFNTGHRDEALQFYRNAYDRDPDDLETLKGLAQLNYEDDNWEVAESYYKSLLEKAGDDWDADRRIAIYRRLGELQMHLGRPENAREFFSEVLHLQPEDTATLLDLAQLMEYHEDWDGAIRYRRQIADLLDNGLERWKVLIAIGDTYRERKQDLDSAIGAYNEALQAQPHSRSALVKLLEIHINAKAYREAVNVLHHLIDVEQTPDKKANYTFTIATIYRQELDQPLDAVEYYEKTLDLNNGKLEAFQAVDEILTSERNWEALEANYRKMIARVRGKDMEKLEFMLYKNLGEIYRTRLQKLDMAASSYELAVKLNGDDVRVREILADLYEREDKKLKAIEEHRALVSLEPDRLTSYRKMTELFHSLGMEDNAWFATSVLALARKTNDEEDAFIQKRRSRTLLQPNRALDMSLWGKGLFSKAENPYIGRVFQTIFQGVGSYLEGRDAKEAGLRKKDELSLKDKTMFTSVLNHVSRMLGVPVPKIYVSDRSFGIHIEATMPPVLVIGKDMLHGKTEKDLAFTLGKHLTYFHPMHVLAACYPASVLKVLWKAAMLFVHPDAQIDGVNDPQVQGLVEEMRKRFSPQLANTLTSPVDHFYKRGATPKITQWLNGVELTANHTGLLACMDLETAANALKQENVQFSKLQPKDKAKELVMYSVSEEFASVREALGLKLKKD